jgi:hypothetical protein
MGSEGLDFLAQMLRRAQWPVNATRTCDGRRCTGGLASNGNPAALERDNRHGRGALVNSAGERIAAALPLVLRRPINGGSAATENQ